MFTSRCSVCHVIEMARFGFRLAAAATTDRLVGVFRFLYCWSICWTHNRECLGMFVCSVVLRLTIELTEASSIEGMRRHFNFHSVKSCDSGV
jgi:hypothetical protein